MAAAIDCFRSWQKVFFSLMILSVASVSFCSERVFTHFAHSITKYFAKSKKEV